MLLENQRVEFQRVSENAIALDFLEPYLAPGDSIFVQPITGFVTSRKSMKAEEVAAYWSNVIFPDASEESYSATFPFAKSRLYYVMETIARFARLTQSSNVEWCDFATGEGILLEMLRRNYPSVNLHGTEHSIHLVESLRAREFNVLNIGLGMSQIFPLEKEFDISTLTWTLANSIDPHSLLVDVVANTKIGGLVCIAESSRVLVPFRKSLHDYFSKSEPADLHPSNFSVNTLRCLMEICGLDIVYVNKYFDSDVLLVIGRKTNTVQSSGYADNPAIVADFFRKWAEASRFFENLR